MDGNESREIVGGEIDLVTMSGVTLKRTLNQGTSSENKGTGAFLHYSNIEKNDNDTWSIDGEEIKDSKTYNIAITQYMVASSSGDKNLGFLLYTNGNVTKTDQPSKEFLKAVISQFEKEFPIN